MDRKAYIILTVSFVLFFLSSLIANKLFPPVPVPQNTNTVSAIGITNGLAGTNRSANLTMTNGQVVVSTNSTPFPITRETGKEELLNLESKDVVYTFSSSGGGLKTIALKDYPATVDCDNEKNRSTNNLARLNSPAPIPAMTVLTGGTLETDGQYVLSRLPNDSGVRAERGLSNGLVIIKEFRPSTNFLIKTSVRFENRSAQPLALPQQEWVVGTATPIGRRDESLMLGAQWYNGSKAEHVNETFFANRTLGCLPGTPRSIYTGGESNVAWAAVHNQFFVLLATPNQPASQFVARRINLPAPTKEELAEDSRTMAQPFGFQASLIYPGTIIGPTQSLTREFDLYAGPKEYNTLARLQQNQDLAMNFGFFGFFAKALLLSMNLLNSMGLGYGLAIVAITVIIKLLFWPLTTASTRSMKRMSALQPQMRALQEKYKDDPRKMNMKLMEFMKEHKVSPLGGCLPMMIQIPVFIGFYTMLQSAIELRGARFLWACDLSQADTIFLLPLGFTQFPINPMPLLMGATMIWQARLTPVSPGMDPVQQKIMKYMPLMFMVFLYNFSAGLTLYWTVQNLLTIAQMKLTKTEPDAGSSAKPNLPAPKGPVAKKKK